MATFKVGQRVRLVSYSELSERKVPIGHLGRIYEDMGGDTYRVEWPGYERLSPTGIWRAFGWQLSPLTDPGADKFIERIKKLSREPINEVQTTGIAIPVVPWVSK